MSSMEGITSILSFHGTSFYRPTSSTHKSGVSLLLLPPPPLGECSLTHLTFVSSAVMASTSAGRTASGSSNCAIKSPICKQNIFLPSKIRHSSHQTQKQEPKTKTNNKQTALYSDCCNVAPPLCMINHLMRFQRITVITGFLDRDSHFSTSTNSTQTDNIRIFCSFLLFFCLGVRTPAVAYIRIITYREKTNRYFVSLIGREKA